MMHKKTYSEFINKACALNAEMNKIHFVTSPNNGWRSASANHKIVSTQMNTRKGSEVKGEGGGSQKRGDREASSALGQVARGKVSLANLLLLSIASMTTCFGNYYSFLVAADAYYYGCCWCCSLIDLIFSLCHTKANVLRTHFINTFLINFAAFYEQWLTN